MQNTMTMFILRLIPSVSLLLSLIFRHIRNSVPLKGVRKNGNSKIEIRCIYFIIAVFVIILDFIVYFSSLLISFLPDESYVYAIQWLWAVYLIWTDITDIRRTNKFKQLFSIKEEENIT